MRQQYVDILKGITIIWVLWMHMDMPEIIYPSVQMPLFFFLSGSFFHAKESFLEQIKKDSYRLLLPSANFMLLSCILLTLRGDNSFSWNIIQDIQICRNASITWFLIALFCFRLFSYLFEKYQIKYLFLSISIILYPIGFLWKVKFPYFEVPIIPIQEMFMFGIYYALGFTIGRKLLQNTNIGNTRKFILCLFCIFYIIFVHITNWEIGFCRKIPWLAYGFPYTLCIIYLGLETGRLLNKCRFISISLAYIGKNSIVFYLTHWPIWIFIFKPLEWNLYLVFYIITILEFLLIYLITNNLPWLVGIKKE